MFTSLLVLSFVSRLSHATITCNSIEMLEMSGMVSAVYPEHVCIGGGTNNYPITRSYECDGKGGAIVTFYLSNDCTGAPYGAQDACGGLANCTYIAHCGGEVCPYAVIEQWQGVTQCNGDVPAANAYTGYTKEGYVINVCINNGDFSLKYTCSAQDGLSRSYWNSADCTGHDASQLIYGVGCDAIAEYAVRADCNAVTGSPTVFSQEPTENPTQGTTRSTDGDDDDVKGGNQGEDLWLFVAFSALVTCLMSAFCIVFYFRTKRTKSVADTTMIEEEHNNVAIAKEAKRDRDSESIEEEDKGAVAEDKNEDEPGENKLNNKELIRIWLNGTVGLPQYFAAFMDGGYTSLDIIASISTKDDLNEIGITVKGHQTQFIAHIRKLKDDKNEELYEEQSVIQQTEGVNQNATDAPGLLTKTPSRQRNDTKHDTAATELTVGEV